MFKDFLNYILVRERIISNINLSKHCKYQHHIFNTGTIQVNFSDQKLLSANYHQCIIIFIKYMEKVLTFAPTYNSFSCSTDMEVLATQKPKIPKKKGFQRKNAHLKSRNVGHWTNQEKEFYYIFLKTFRENFVKKELRRTDKIFKEMAKFIKTRAADQCRSHHQKMEKKH